MGLTYLASDEAWSMPRRPRSPVARGELLAEPREGVAGRISDVPTPFVDRNGAAVSPPLARR